MSRPTPATAAGTAPSPSRDDSETTQLPTCPVCARPFTPIGRQRYCRPACRKRAHRRRSAVSLDVRVPTTVSRPQRTIY